MNRFSKFLLKLNVRKYSNTYLKSCLVNISHKSYLIDYDTRRIIIQECKRRGLI